VSGVAVADSGSARIDFSFADKGYKPDVIRVALPMSKPALNPILGLGKREQLESSLASSELFDDTELLSLDSESSPCKRLQQEAASPSTRLQIIKSLVYSKGKTDSSIVQEIKRVIDARTSSEQTSKEALQETPEETSRDLSDLGDIEILSSSDFL